MAIKVLFKNITLSILLPFIKKSNSQNCLKKYARFKKKIINSLCLNSSIVIKFWEGAPESRKYYNHKQRTTYLYSCKQFFHIYILAWITFATLFDTEKHNHITILIKSAVKFICKQSFGGHILILKQIIKENNKNNLYNLRILYYTYTIYKSIAKIFAYHTTQIIKSFIPK
ncbi:hypothetical protein AGLY_004081 [Aphis glycines]|uniref:Uncharacterized protein n=1 Tax=Aphis glycines TaxID=307491 RepID=A0A6G0TX52_APHGL|nr:hypothetical protein AGLY_004081 [Aphis glycines]